MCEPDFFDPQLQHRTKKSINYDKLSRYERKFLYLMDEKAVKVDGHYELPLPLKDKDIIPPINRATLIKRLESLKKEVLKG